MVFLGTLRHLNLRTALIIGRGGAGRAAALAFGRQGRVSFLSRKPQHPNDTLATHDLSPEKLKTYDIIIQATPLGTPPYEKEAPAIPYDALLARQCLYDMAYNPPLSPFLKKGIAQGCFIKNGLEMLYLQAEASWEVWAKEL